MLHYEVYVIYGTVPRNGHTVDFFYSFNTYLAILASFLRPLNISAPQVDQYDLYPIIPYTHL